MGEPTLNHGRAITAEPSEELVSQLEWLEDHRTSWSAS
jgi:hypothetical protein